jgi:acyl-homoserine-lactone acylase
MAIVAAGLCVVTAASAGAGAAAAQPGQGFDAIVRTTSHGIPHIKADDFGGVGFGFGYFFAKDNICEAAEIYLTTAADRSRFFGPDGTYETPALNFTVDNLASDFFFQRIIDDRVVEELVAQQPPKGPLPRMREIVRGYVAGYNKYLREIGVDNLPDPRCRGEAWVRPIRPIDVYRRTYALTTFASSGAAIEGIAHAQPPTPPITGRSSEAALPTEAEMNKLSDSLRPGGLGSNAIALGRDATENGKGMLLGNPHFPWRGPERFYQAQLTVPGKLDVSGASLFGVPLTVIGYNRRFAWSHTVSTAFRFTPFELTLVPGSPTTYLVDGEPREMERDAVTVDVRAADGSIERRSRTLYSTVYGSMFNSVGGQDLFPWTSGKAFALGDANATNLGRGLNHFLSTNAAESVEEYDRIHRRFQGIPFVNSLAADSSGDAYYADLSVVPHVSDERARRCNTPLGAALFEAARLPVLDGSRSDCDWGSDPSAIEPGIFGPDESLPSLFREDYVENSNDSHWLSNPSQPLTGFARIIGNEDTERALRTRIGLIMIQERLAGGGRFTLRRLQDLQFDNRNYSGELFRDALVGLCQESPVLVSSDGGVVDVREACPVLARWDVRADIDSRGAVLFREFARRAVEVAGGPYSDSYSSADPVNTPRGLRTEDPRIRQALADAVDALRSRSIPLDARLGDFQYREANGRIPLHGAPDGVGVFNVVLNTDQFYDREPNAPETPVDLGSSYIQAVQFPDGGCPVDARTLLTYSQSTNTESRFFSDQTQLFSDKEWVDTPFCEREILADPNLEVTRLTSRSGEGENPGGDGPRRRGSGRREGAEDRGGDRGGRAGTDLERPVANVDRPSSGDGGALPFTGLTLALLGALGFASLVLGLALRRRSRR